MSEVPGQPWSVFVWTEKGKLPHISEDGGVTTRCGRPVVGPADADNVLWFGVCKKCQRDESSWT